MLGIAHFSASGQQLLYKPWVSVARRDVAPSLVSMLLSQKCCENALFVEVV